MVKQLATGKNVVPYSAGSKTRSSSTAVRFVMFSGIRRFELTAMQTTQASAYGGGPCLRGNSICEDSSNQVCLGRDQGSSTGRGLARNTDSSK